MTSVRVYRNPCSRYKCGDRKVLINVARTCNSVQLFASRKTIFLGRLRWILLPRSSSRQPASLKSLVSPFGSILWRNGHIFTFSLADLKPRRIERDNSISTWALLLWPSHLHDMTVYTLSFWRITAPGWCTSCNDLHSRIGSCNWASAPLLVRCVPPARRMG